MKVHTFKTIFTALALACLIPMANAQFDDVYYDPDHVVAGTYDDDESTFTNENLDEVTYYDDDEYEYYDDYDYYYSSRIRRFHQPYTGFGFYDPCYVSFNSYDPFYSDAYYYPGSSIYISFGGADYWSYRHWRRWNQWNRWNSYNGWNSWYHTPASYYYSYNNWCSPGYNYWGGNNGYYSYSNYYNNYYNSCPYPVSNYYGVTHGTITNIDNGTTRGSYYGPRIAGNTGSSPRGPVTKPESIQPVFKETGKTVDQTTGRQTEVGGTKPGGIVRSNPEDVQPGVEKTPANTTPREVNSNDIVRKIPIDKELDKETSTPTTRRPVFKPYPSDDKTNTPSSNRVESKPSSPSSGTNSPRQNETNPVREDAKPQYQPAPRNDQEKPAYTPTERTDKPSYTPRTNDRPSYTPPSRNSERSDEKPSYNPRNEDKPNYTPSQRSNESREEKPSYSPTPRNNDSGRSNDRPSYSPPSRQESSGSRSQSSSPSRDNSSSSGSRSSGTSPRSPGRG
ncbi:MAG TPA: hypothetical protein VMZ69_04070 [Saprospiraceae bacterium]|nr:hypothetical protein [Saprospiraceae bacterium]